MSRSYRLYSELASWWPLLVDRNHCSDQSALYTALMDQALGRRAMDILELGSGSGALASHFEPDRQVVLTDISTEMLSVSERNNPDKTHVQCDMRTVRLPQQFDAVLLHDAVMYITSPVDLVKVCKTAAAHLKPHGVFLVLPDVVKEDFKEMTVNGGSLGQPGAQLMEWHWDPNPYDHTFQIDMTLLLKDKDGVMESIHEQHQLALFDRRTYVLSLREAGFTMVPDLIWDEHLTPEVFCGRKS